MNEIQNEFGGGLDLKHLGIPCINNLPGEDSISHRPQMSKRTLSMANLHSQSMSNFHHVRKKTHFTDRRDQNTKDFYTTKDSNFTAQLMMKSPKSNRSNSFKFWKNGNSTNSIGSEFRGTHASGFPIQNPKIGAVSKLFPKKNVFFTEPSANSFIKADFFTARRSKNPSVIFYHKINRLTIYH